MLGINQKTIDVAFPRDLLQDTLVIVVAKRSAEFVIAHVRFVFVMAPPDGNCLRLQHTEFPLLYIGSPLNDVAVFLVWVGEQRIHKLPQLNSPFSYCKIKKIRKSCYETM